jgi:hypothetical protein
MPDQAITGGMFDNMSAGALFASILWGGIGGGFLIYGWRQKTLMPFLVGLALSVVSCFFLNSALWMSVISIAIIAGFIWYKKQGC